MTMTVGKLFEVFKKSEHLPNLVWITGRTLDSIDSILLMRFVSMEVQFQQERKISYSLFMADLTLEDLRLHLVDQFQIVFARNSPLCMPKVIAKLLISSLFLCTRP
jgi:hypothetical protein